MRRKTTNINLKLILILLLLMLSVGYAALQSILNINGISTINNATWDIHFENVVINSGSVLLGQGISLQ